MTDDDVNMMWARFGGELTEASRLAIVPGPAPRKGAPKKMVQVEMVTELVRIAFTQGLRMGFTRGVESESWKAIQS